jgi:hypothetical protein
VPRFVVPNILPINSYLCWPAVLFCVSATRDSSRPLTTIHLWCCASLWYSICQCNVSMGLERPQKKMKRGDCLQPTRGIRPWSDARMIHGQLLTQSTFSWLPMF